LTLFSYHPEHGETAGTQSAFEAGASLSARGFGALVECR
jgi:hypothetical protein